MGTKLLEFSIGRGLEALKGLTLNLREPVAPVAYQVILEPGIGRFRRVGVPPSAYSYIRRNFFLRTKSARA